MVGGGIGGWGTANQYLIRKCAGRKLSWATEAKSGTSSPKVLRRLPWGLSPVSEDEWEPQAKLTEGWGREGGVCSWVVAGVTAKRCETILCLQINVQGKQEAECGERRAWRER